MTVMIDEYGLDQRSLRWMGMPPLAGEYLELRSLSSGVGVWVASFSWRIHAMDDLRRCMIIIVNTCLLCLADEELVDPLLLNCKVA